MVLPAVCTALGTSFQVKELGTFVCHRASSHSSYLEQDRPFSAQLPDTLR